LSTPAPRFDPQDQTRAQRDRRRVAEFDCLHPIEFQKRIGEGNVAAGIVLASIIFAPGIIVASLVRA
jgi:hypothetical protein